MDLGKRIRKARKAKKLTQEQLGKTANVSDATINRYEKGIRQPDPEMLGMIADILDVSVDYLLGRTDSPRPNAEVNKFDYSELFSQKDKGQAYILAADLRSRYNLSDETFLKIIDEIASYYKKKETGKLNMGGGAQAAHGPEEPGTSIFKKKDLEGDFGD